MAEESSINANMGQHSPVGWVGRAWKVGVEGGAKEMAERRMYSCPLGPEVGRGKGGTVHLSAILHLLPKLFHPMAMEQSRAVGQITPEACSLGHSAGLLSLADPGLLVMPIKSLDVYIADCSGGLLLLRSLATFRHGKSDRFHRREARSMTWA